MQEAFAGYNYTLVVDGIIVIDYNDLRLTLRRGDLFFYSPGAQSTVISATADYRAISLICDEGMTFEMPVTRYLVRAAYYPTMMFGLPTLHLSEPQMEHFQQLMQTIIAYLHSGHQFLDKSLRALYSLFLLDLMNVVVRQNKHKEMSEHVTEQFIAFLRLLSHHFVEHHDIGFYASELCITTTHLSRIVRQVSGRTVVDFINRQLFMEAAWLLRSTDLTVAAIADRLHFATPASFTKFFVRMRGVSPKEYRRR